MDIKGINADLGIKRVANNKSLYLGLLKRFAERYENVAEQITTYRIEADYSQLEHLAHSMKGASGNIGAETLYVAFSELEKLSKHGGDTEAFIILEEQIAVEMENIIKSIYEALSNSISPVNTINDTLNILPIYKLIKHLENGSSEAVDLWRDIKTAFGQVYGISKAKTIEDYMMEYDFDEAIQYLEDLLSTVEE